VSDPQLGPAAVRFAERRGEPGLLRHHTRRGGAGGLAVTELSTHLQGQLVATHPAYDVAFADFAPPELAQDAKGRQHGRAATALAAQASQRLGLTAHATFSGRWRGPSFIRGRSGRRV